MMDLTPGQAAKVGALLKPTRYRPLGFLGRGGMGEVYVVIDEFLGKRFALKILNQHCASAQAADRLRFEAQAMARLHSQHVVTVVDFWLDAGTPCFVMQLLTGRNLAQELAHRVRIPPVEAIDLACQVLKALVSAHELGIVHRDIKPENLYLHEVRGGGRELKVLDFGFASLMPEPSPLAPTPLAVPTQTGVVVGTTRYMSPELAGGAAANHLTDQFALGVVLYLMLTGDGPYDMTDRALPPSVCAKDAGIHPELDEIVLRAIHERPECRYPSSADLSSALAEIKRSRY